MQLVKLLGMQIHITSSNSTETLAHYLKVCSCCVYWEEYAVNVIIFVLFCIRNSAVPLYYLATRPNHLLSALQCSTHSHI